MDSLKKRLIALAILPLLLLALPIFITPPLAVASNEACGTNTHSQTFHNPDNTTSVVVQVTTRCTNHLDDTYQYLSTSTYLVKYGYYHNWLFTWGISEQWVVDLTTNTISSYQNPPSVIWSICCNTPDGSPEFITTGTSTSATQLNSQQIKATGSTLVWFGAYTCDPQDPFNCATLYYPYDSVSCTFYATLTTPSGSCSG